MKNKVKILFEQTVTISTLILLAIGLEGSIRHMMGLEVVYDWYDPPAIIGTGFLCSLPTLVLISDREWGRGQFIACVVVHCALLLGIVSLIGYFSHWYSDGGEYLRVAGMYFTIYVLVWLTTFWLERREAGEINKAIQEIRDEE